MDSKRVTARRTAGIALFVFALLASILAELPGELPEVALGWPLLLHLERAAAAVAIVGFTFLVIWRAGRGEFPIRFGQIEYETREVADEMKRGIQVLQSRTEELERATRDLAAVVDGREEV